MAGVDEFIDPALLPRGPVRLAAFDGENADPANGRTMGDGVRAHTPWGELAYALAGPAGYERVRNSDESGVAPGADTLRELFGGEPALILLDELSVYLRKVQQVGAARDQLTAFLTSLFKAVEGTPRAALVYTLAIGKEATRNLEAGFELTFAEGLPMAGDAAETFTDGATRAGGAPWRPRRPRRATSSARGGGARSTPSTRSGRCPPRRPRTSRRRSGSPASAAATCTSWSTACWSASPAPASGPARPPRGGRAATPSPRTSP